MTEHVRVARAEQRLIGLSLHFGNHDDKKAATHISPPSTTRRLDEKPPRHELGMGGLNTDEIARAAFSSIQFKTNDTTVLDGKTYYHLSKGTDQLVKQTLYALFGVSLSVAELDENISALELNRYGWVESREETKLDLSQRIVHAKIAELALLACASLSPMMVASVSAVLSSLADSLQSMSAVLQKNTVDCNIFSTDENSIVLINSRFSTEQTASKWMGCFCGMSRTRILLSLQIRRIGFSTRFMDMVRVDSPIVRRRIQGERHLLPPSPELPHRSMTAPSSVPIRMSRRALPRVQQLQMEALGKHPRQMGEGVEDTPPLSQSPLSVVRELGGQAKTRE